MNVTEANATQTVLAWVLALQLVETSPAAPTDEQLRQAVALLAERSHKALGAGIWREDAVHCLSGVLALRAEGFQDKESAASEPAWRPPAQRGTAGGGQP